MARTTSRLSGLVLTVLAMAAGAAPLAGCRGDRSDKPPRRFFPGMDDQPKWEAQERTEFFADNRTARPKVEGTVAFGPASFDPEAHASEAWARGLLAERESMLASDDAIYRGVTYYDDGTETYVDDIPLRVTEDMVERGRERFNIYCSACHGYLGDGRGMVGRRWSYPPANLLGDVYRDRANRQGKDGYIFHVIRNGVWNAADGANRMPAYGDAIDVMDAWAIVAYLRALQTSQTASIESLDPGDRRRLRREQGAGPGTPAGGAGGTGSGVMGGE